eukprot:674265-Rhodomonas_salina.5
MLDSISLLVARSVFKLEWVRIEIHRHEIWLTCNNASGSLAGLSGRGDLVCVDPAVPDGQSVDHDQRCPIRLHP